MEPNNDKSNCSDPMDDMADILGDDLAKDVSVQDVMLWLQGLGLGQQKQEKSTEPPMTLEDVAKLIKSNPNLKVVVMSGAGLSVAAGIPDFRTPGTGLYSNLQKYNLPYAEAVFELRYFKSNPEPFYQLARELFPGNYFPTRAHFFCRLLEEKGLLLKQFSQNIDMLERVAGVTKIVEAHGSFHAAHCVDCDGEYDINRIKETIFQRREGPVEIPRCDRCKGYVKPKIVFFGENLPEEFFRSIPLLQQADLLLVLGTSLVVHPFASLVSRVRENVPRVLINREPVGPFREPQPTDVLLLGDCDDGVQKLCELLGWTDDLNKLVETARQQFQQKNNINGNDNNSSKN